MSTTAEVRSVRIGGQILRVAVRPGLSGPGAGPEGQPPRVLMLLINGIGASLELLGPFLAALELRQPTFSCPAMMTRSSRWPTSG